LIGGALTGFHLDTRIVPPMTAAARITQPPNGFLERISFIRHM
jgi:hypothetical protein